MAYYTVNRIAEDLATVLALPTPEFPGLPKPLLAIGSSFRPGLSAKKISSEIISQFPKIDIENGDNVWEKYTTLLVQTLIDAIVYDAKVSVALKPSDIGIIQCAGGNAGGPIIVTGTNTTFGGANGVIS